MAHLDSISQIFETILDRSCFKVVKNTHSSRNGKMPLGGVLFLLVLGIGICVWFFKRDAKTSNAKVTEDSVAEAQRTDIHRSARKKPMPMRVTSEPKETNSSVPDRRNSAPSLITPPSIQEVSASTQNTSAPIRNDVLIEISGKVLFKGDPPQEKVIEDRQVLLQCRGLLFNYIVAEDGSLANVFVYIKSGLEGKTFPVPESKIEIQQTECLSFEPYVFGVQVGQTVSIRLDAKKLRAKLFKLRLNSGVEHAWGDDPDRRPEGNLEVVFSGGDIFSTFTSQNHPWDWGYVGVVTHPYFAVTGKDGSFTLPKGIPPGNYTIAAHHPKAGELVQPIVAEGGNYNLVFTFQSAPGPTP